MHTVIIIYMYLGILVLIEQGKVGILLFLAKKRHLAQNSVMTVLSDLFGTITAYRLLRLLTGAPVSFLSYF